MANELDPLQCPICEANLSSPLLRSGEVFPVDCMNCGRHRLSRSADEELTSGAYRQKPGTAALGYAVRRLREGAMLTARLLADIASTVALPKARERIDNLVLFLGDTKAPGVREIRQLQHWQAIVGSENAGGARWVLQQASKLGLIEGMEKNPSGSGTDGIMLSIAGWDRYADLLRTGAKSEHAFMAMKFGDEELTHVYRNHLRPAVAQTGFDLRTTNEDHKTAGLIDNRMRVEIRTSRFVVCDLTHGNRGAYWEAGFAEGLGRPVFYTCRADVLADRAHSDHPHFDTAHQLIISWDPVNPDEGMAELKAVIRATLPAEARMEDSIKPAN